MGHCGIQGRGLQRFTFLDSKKLCIGPNAEAHMQPWREKAAVEGRAASELVVVGIGSKMPADLKDTNESVSDPTSLRGDAPNDIKQK